MTSCKYENTFLSENGIDHNGITNSRLFKKMRVHWNVLFSVIGARDRGSEALHRLQRGTRVCHFEVVILSDLLREFKD